MKKTLVNVAKFSVVAGALIGVNSIQAESGFSFLGSGLQVRSSILALNGANSDAISNEADKSGEGKCGEGKCGEGKCGEGKKEDKGAEAKCGEGKCGE